MVRVLVLASFLITFAFIRTSARINRNPDITWWPGSVKTANGLHIHHLIWGVALTLTCGFLTFALEPEGWGHSTLAIGFGIAWLRSRRKVKELEEELNDPAALQERLTALLPPPRTDSR